MGNMIDREEAPSIVYAVCDTNAEVVEVFEDEDQAYDFAGTFQRVVTYRKA